MKRGPAVTLLLAGVLLGPAGKGAQAPAPGGLESKFEQTVPEYSLRADNFLQALTKVAARFQIPMGIEWRRSPETLRGVDESWRHATVGEILQSLVGSRPGYRLQIRDGVARVFPREALTDKRDFLNLPIVRFEVRDEYVGIAERRLHRRLNAIVNPPLLEPSGKPAGGMLGSITIGGGDRKATWVVENVTVRDVLDRLATSADFKVWVVSYPERLTRTHAGFRRSISIYSSGVSDEGQPAWDLLLWGFDPVTKTPQPEWGSAPRQ